MKDNVNKMNLSEIASESTSQFEFKAEMKQLLNLIIHSLYTHPEIFLRELISNSSDALNKLRFKRLIETDIAEPETELRIDIELDKANSIFSIEDTGIGMSKDDLINQIGTIARSGTLEFLQSLKNGNKAIDAQLIGKFGVGFYSVFMVTDEVIIETRFADKDSVGYRWKSNGEEKFSIEEIDRQKRGTKIYFKLKETFKDFAEDLKVKDVLKKYSNFVDFPIYINKERINLVQALWHKSKDDVREEELEEFYKFIANDFEKPIAHLHLSIEGSVNFKSLIFIPKSAPPYFLREFAEKSLQLYCSKVFIQENCKELLPDYLRFVRGVVDTEDLPLNVSRELTQSSPVMVKIRNILTGKILNWLEELAIEKPTIYQEIYKNFGTLIKTGITSDYINKDKIIRLLRYETSLLEKGALASLKDYVSRMKDGQNDIFYISGESWDSIDRNPNLEYFKKNSFEVIYLTDPVDIFTFPYIMNYDNKQLVSIDKSDLNLVPTSSKISDSDISNQDLSPELSQSLISVFKEVLADKVEDVVISKRLVTSPVTIVSGKQAVDPQVEKMMKALDKDFTASKRILEINTSHLLIRNLSTLNLAAVESTASKQLLNDSIIQLYEAALLREGNLTSTFDFIERLYQFMEKSTNLSDT